MNPEQHLKYRICGAQAVKAMRKLGHQGTHKELTAWCRRKALGVDKPSTALNNNEFDAVLAVFAGFHSMTDLAEQLRILEQPLKRILFAAAPYLDKLQIAEHGREGYLAAIYKRVQSQRPARGERVYALADIPDEDFPLILGALNHTLQHKTGARKQWRRRSSKPAAQRPADRSQPSFDFAETDPENPF